MSDNLQDPRNPRSPYNRYNPDSPWSVTNPNSPHYDARQGLASVLAVPMLIVLCVILKVVYPFVPNDGDGFVSPVGFGILAVITFLVCNGMSWLVSKIFD